MKIVLTTAVKCFFALFFTLVFLLTPINPQALRTEVTDSGALWRSAVAPGWGQFYKQRTGWGYVYSLSFGAGLVTSVTSLVLWQNYNSRYKNYQPDYVVSPTGGVSLSNASASQAELDRLSGAADSWQTATVVSGIATLTIYTFCLIDAYFGVNPNPSPNQKPKDARLGLPIDFYAVGNAGLGISYKASF